MKRKIGFLSLCVICLALAGCFHIPDEDWIFTKNNEESESTNYERQEFIESINTVADILNDWNISNDTNNEIKNEENLVTDDVLGTDVQQIE